MKKLYFLLFLSIISLSCSSGNYYVTPEYQNQLFKNCIMGVQLSFLHLSLFKSGNLFDNLIEEETGDTLDKIFNVGNTDFDNLSDYKPKYCRIQMIFMMVITWYSMNSPISLIMNQVLLKEYRNLINDHLILSGPAC